MQGAGGAGVGIIIGINCRNRGKSKNCAVRPSSAQTLTGPVVIDPETRLCRLSRRLSIHSCGVFLQIFRIFLTFSAIVWAATRLTPRRLWFKQATTAPQSFPLFICTGEDNMHILVQRIS